VFLRGPGGKFTTLDYPGASGTAASGINDAGEVVGTFFGADGTHGFLRDGRRRFITPDNPAGCTRTSTASTMPATWFGVLG
jgi:probable HAF family extracellular repeat protein